MDTAVRLKQVSTGLRFIYMALLLNVLLAITIGFVGGAASAARRGPGGGSDMESLLKVLAVATIAIGALSIYGQLLCTKVPEDMPGRSFITTSVTLSAISLLAGVLNLLPEGTLPQGVAAFLGLFGFVGMVVFLLFLERLAQFLQQCRADAGDSPENAVELAVKARSLLILTIGVLSCYVLVIAGGVAMASAGGIVARNPGAAGGGAPPAAVAPQAAFLGIACSSLAWSPSLAVCYA